MADEVRSHVFAAPGDLPVRYRDMGDGTYALVVVAEAVVVRDGDQIRKHVPRAVGDIPLRFQDLGDGSYALVVVAG